MGAMNAYTATQYEPNAVTRHRLKNVRKCHWAIVQVIRYTLNETGHDAADGHSVKL
ncbi:hypothetical protein FOCG_04185 [Fusarium oxysporum f. sp. radicis-lycopersici 26381]|uniref:Uncharacterized protein n=3 Tax=Fusarium oxysporum TaxID=5507 RepID=A0A0J9UTR8_FUSO4|nr:hypothetical protein FOXG_19013 [Fusarium oxysporum f. sp. lycopersici 4287]EWZ37178.1 hypothetical protein FOZG_11002 [Fusarium oxysporum Fo47]EWZ90153.1 hypothetical protein FOWG_07904 [Fusarium oxysporum f. sp. lycopersici MN25]EXK39219.1 hypothetical protein FOMG_06613 [Fusarium oxysporum f. sp. melonis 26406]EXL56649.1 hypothetical protein FOCG_04185 [Fusarium oxysporum f. sp. radicis-lycopersici 26381]KNB02288.1 hypothetical protein FOXG_19013 [Fusarium oxysporum f. sp. lycopersici 42